MLRVTTLPFVLPTITYRCRQEDQNRNAQAIADRGANLTTSSRNS